MRPSLSLRKGTGSHGVLIPLSETAMEEKQAVDEAGSTVGGLWKVCPDPGLFEQLQVVGGGGSGGGGIEGGGEGTGGGGNSGGGATGGTPGLGGSNGKPVGHVGTGGDGGGTGGGRGNGGSLDGGGLVSLADGLDKMALEGLAGGATSAGGGAAMELEPPSLPMLRTAA